MASYAIKAWPKEVPRPREMWNPRDPSASSTLEILSKVVQRRIRDAKVALADLGVERE